MIAGVVALAELVGEAALRVPREQPCVIAGNLLHAGIAQFGSFLVLPCDLVRVPRVGHRLVGLIHPLGNGAEVENHRVSFRGLEKVDGHRIDHGKVPGSRPILGRLQLRNPQFRVRQPWHIADVIGSQVMQSPMGFVVHRRAAPQGRVDHDLESGSGLGYANHLIPMNHDLSRRILGLDISRCSTSKRKPHKP